MNGFVAVLFVITIGMTVHNVDSEATPEQDKALQEYLDAYIAFRAKIRSESDWSPLQAIKESGRLPPKYFTATILVDDWDKVFPHQLYSSKPGVPNKEQGLHEDYVFSSPIDSPQISQRTIDEVVEYLSYENNIEPVKRTKYTTKVTYFSGPILPEDNDMLRPRKPDGTLVNYAFIIGGSA